ncbi:MAG TPA: hypothetical protein VIV40_32210 [Kofleriaceae bacterium]
MMRLLLIVAFASACTDVYDYDPTSAGQPEGNERAPRGKSSSQFLRGIYADLLGRTPESYEIVIKFQGTEVFRFTADEEALLSNSLDGLGDSLPMRNLIANGILHSSEITIPDKAAVTSRDYIRDQFRRLLGREPNTYELEAFAAEWDNDPAVGPRTIIRAIIASREYQSQ